MQDPGGLTPLSSYRTEPIGQFVVLWHPAMAEEDPGFALRVRAALIYDLESVTRSVSPGALRALAGTRLAVAPATPRVPTLPSGGRGAGTHVSAAWLVAHGFDAEREGAIEIYDARDYLAWRAEQPLMMLHELTHVLEMGANRATLALLEQAFRKAVDAGSYEAVPYILAPLGVTRRAYAIGNFKEYGAELSEAFYGRNDYYPYTRPDLIAHDPSGCHAVAALWMTSCPPG